MVTKNDQNIRKVEKQKLIATQKKLMTNAEYKVGQDKGLAIRIKAKESPIHKQNLIIRRYCKQYKPLQKLKQAVETTKLSTLLK